MKVYVTARFRGADNKQEIEALCEAVDNAGLRSFCFVRDVENYKHTFDDPKELWERTLDEIGACDALLIDASDHPTGGRLVEAGIAYARRMPVIVVKKQGVSHKALFDGIASTIITYKDQKDLTRQLKEYDKDRNFTITDKTTLLIMFLLLGGVISWALMQLFIPLGLIGAVVYWLIVRRFFASIRAFDRIVIYIPLAAAWWAGYSLLYPVDTALSLGWTAGFWLVALFVLRKLKFSL